MSAPAPRTLPLGRAFWRLQAALLIASLTDACMIVAPLWWIIVGEGLELSTDDGRAKALTQILAVLTWPALVRLIALPLLAPLGDALPRGRVLAIALALRASPWLSLALIPDGNLASVRALVALSANAALGGLCDSVSLALVPRLVPPSEAARAISISAGLPRAGFFLSTVIGLVLIGLFGARTMTFTGAALLITAAFIGGTFAKFNLSTEELQSERGARSRWSLLGALDGGRGPLWLCAAAALVNFAVYPLYWVGPTLAAKVNGDNLEVAIVCGSILGLFSLGVLSRLKPARAIGGAMVALGAAVAALAFGWSPLLVGGAIGAAFSAAQLLLIANAIARAPDRARARVAALFAALFAGAGEISTHVVQPTFAAGRPPLVLAALGGALAIAGVVLARSRLLDPAQAEIAEAPPKKHARAHH